MLHNFAHSVQIGAALERAVQGLIFCVAVQIAATQEYIMHVGKPADVGIVVGAIIFFLFFFIFNFFL